MDESVRRGFFAAFDARTGEEVWHFWTVPKRGEPGFETWQGRDIEHPCATAWLTGTFDSESETLYWPTGNPCPDFDGDHRLGDNLYSDSILALDVKTGRLKWHYQFTPHDVWDWDAQQPPVLIDLDWAGTRRKLLLHANRNGFFYVLDRVTGELLRAKPFVRKLTWAREIGSDGRPVRNPDQEPTLEGTWVCPAIRGRDQLVLDRLPPGNRPLLRADPREVQHLYQEALGVAGGKLLLQRLDENAARGHAAKGSPRHRRSHRCDRVAASTDRARRLMGRHPRDWRRARLLR